MYLFGKTMATMTFDEIKEECAEMQAELECLIPDDVNGAIERGKEIAMWLAANGNKPLVSQKASVKGANLTQDTDKDFEQIQSESAASSYVDTFEPTI